MFSKLKIGLVALGAMLLSACGEIVEVPSAHVGKILSKEYSEEIYRPGRFRLEPCLASVCERLVIADVSARTVPEVFNLVMPRDRLRMAFEIGVTYTVDPERTGDLFDTLPVREIDSRNSSISTSSAYNTYVRPIIVSETRNYLSQFSIEEVMTQRAEISIGLRDHLKEKVESQTAFLIANVGLNSAEPPEVITEGQLNTARHAERIRVEEQEQIIDEIRLERQLINESKQRLIDIERAEANAEVNRIVADAMTPEYERYRMLEILDNFSRGDSTTLIPLGALDSMATQFMIGNSITE